MGVGVWTQVAAGGFLSPGGVSTTGRPGTLWGDRLRDAGWEVLGSCCLLELLHKALSPTAALAMGKHHSGGSGAEMRAREGLSG